MRKLTAILLLACTGIFLFHQFSRQGDSRIPTNTLKPIEEGNESGEDEAEEQDGILLSQQQDFNNTRDIRLGYIPQFKLIAASENLVKERRAMRKNNALRLNALTWTERGPNSDLTGPSNGNLRGPSGTAVTSGRIRAIFVDLADATNKTVWVGGVDGGIWKTNDITASPATWTPINDFLGNLAVTSICQDPTNNNIMYFGTGEKSFNVDAIRGGGIWKSTDHGVTWNLLPSTTNFWNVSKLACDAAGNVYAATVSSGSGLQRSTDGGTTWTNITPAGLTSRISEMKISSTGRMHIVCGYFNTAAGVAGYRFTTTPATVTSATWTSPTTTFTSGPTQVNCEIATAGNTLYALNSDASYQTPQIFKSTDGGANWAATATSPPVTGNSNTDLSSQQGWYCLAIGVDPSNANNVVVGGLNTYRSINGGSTWTQVARWVGNAMTYVHADQHFVTWNGTQVLLSSDGGLFYSSNGGGSFADRNAGLRIKQFYSCAMHPTTTNYFLGGAQDNGVHKLTSAGLGASVEVTGGDGGFVHIDQDQPQYQFGSYVYNQYKRSTDGGNTWTGIDYSNSIGQFINASDYDDGNNKMYAGGSPGQYVRWEDPQTGSSFTQVPVPAFSGGSVTHVMVSPYTSNRVYFGTDNGKIIQADNANGSPTTTDLTGSGMTVSTVSCVAVGTTSNNLIATFSNFGAPHVWMTTTGGGSAAWTNISGNLPDIPVRWAMFYPYDDTKAILATEAGIYETNNINGAATVWTQNASFPIVRTDMLQFRPSDGTIIAATHGRGMWSATLPVATPYVQFAGAYATQMETTAVSASCRGYKDYTLNMTISAAPVGTATATLSAAGSAVQGVDYDFTTNGSFAAPSNIVTFNDGVTAVQTVTIRVYDDADVEAMKSFTLSYSLSGSTTAVAGPSFQTFIYNINDNDVVAVAPYVGNFSVGTYNANIGSGTPFESDMLKNRLQVLFTAAELQAAGLTTASNLSSMTIRVVTKNSTKPFTGFTISMMNTGATTLGGGYIPGVYTQVFNGNYTTVVGNNTFNFSTPFAWDGTSNIVIQFCFDNAPGSADASPDVVEGNNAPIAGVPTVLSNYVSGGTAGCSLGAVFISYARMNATFAGTAGYAVESVVNASKNAYLGKNNDVYFFNTNNKIIARITNGGTQDFGCTQVIVDRAGNGTSAFWNAIPSNYLTTKSFRVIPTTNNASASYTITLFYTAAEKSAWEAATGNIWTSIKIIKVKSQISNYTPATPSPDGPGAVEIATPVFANYGTDYTLTATFNTGFSGFAAGVPGLNPLPVTLVNFKGTLNKDRSAQLDWATLFEQNTKNFDLEKSTDGLHYFKAASIRAAGNSNERREYAYIDRQLSPVNYYRLRMNDMDGRTQLSQVVMIRVGDVQQNAWVVNNPFTDHIDIRFALDASRVKTELINASGTVVMQKNHTIGGSLLQWNIPGSLPKGSYVLRTYVDDQVFTSKVLKQ